MKHIGVVYIRVNNTVFFQIIFQTHIGYDFGENGSASFRCTNGILLTSSSRPENRYPEIFVRGSSLQNEVLYTHYSKWVKIKAAILEYNRHFGNEIEDFDIPEEFEDENTFSILG